MATKKTAYEAPTPASDKKKALQTALSQIDKNFGKGTVMRLGDRTEMIVEAIPTGSLALDAALGIGGVPAVETVTGHGLHQFFCEKVLKIPAVVKESDRRNSGVIRSKFMMIFIVVVCAEY